jgi:hypothetical protein
VDEVGWKALLESLVVAGNPHPVLASALNTYERQAEFELPSSYRNFCRVFGPGDIGDWYSVAVPGFEGKPRSRNRYDLGAKTAFYRNGRDWEEYAADAEQFKRAVIFADDCTGAVYFWDPAEVTESATREQAIYAVWRDWSQERVSDTFWGFVNICLHRGERTLYDESPRVGFRAAWFARSGRKRNSTEPGAGAARPGD